MKITGGAVFCSDKTLKTKDLCFENGVITENSTCGEFNASGCYVLPGFIDTHNHGAFGTEFSSPDQDFSVGLDKLCTLGVTAVLATTRSLFEEELYAAARNIKRQNDERVLGIHMEGPFVNPARIGAMNRQKLRNPDINVIKIFQKESGGMLKIVSLAPETENGFETVKYCAENGITVSMAHTDATFEQAEKAHSLGATRLTHTYNGMRPFTHRDPGVLGYALTTPEIQCELICDLYHVSSAAIKVAVKCKGTDNITMISDSGVFAGLGDGEYIVDGRVRYVKDGLCLADDKKTIAGSTKTLYDGVKNMFSLGFSPAEIAVMASLNPARACGDTTRGSLDTGKRADIVVLDKNFDITAVFYGGERIV